MHLIIVLITSLFRLALLLCCGPSCIPLSVGEKRDTKSSKKLLRLDREELQNKGLYARSLMYHVSQRMV